MLPRFGYTEKEIAAVNQMILSTEIPQHPVTLLDQILCDADLDYLGRKDFFITAEKLRHELAVHFKEFTDEEWLRFELAFLEKHHYFTETSQKKREPIKQQHIIELHRQLHHLIKI